MKNLENYAVSSIDTHEMSEVNGGHVPASYYMDDAAIKATEKIAKEIIKSLGDAYDWVKGFEHSIIPLL